MQKIIYTFWTGENEMSEARRNCLKSMDRAGVGIALITPNTLPSFIIEPLHDAFQYLSLVHKSDYLRCYFMHHYGGGYQDIKFIKNSWVRSFNDFEQSDKDIVGYREVQPNHVAPVGGDLEILLKQNYKKLIGCGAFICAPKTEFTTQWINRMHKELDKYLDDLRRNPGNIMGDNPNYPLKWTQIMGNIFHPLCLELIDNIGYDERIKPDFGRAYR
jgi:hypothetical protein